AFGVSFTTGSFTDSCMSALLLAAEPRLLAVAGAHARVRLGPLLGGRSRGRRGRAQRLGSAPLAGPLVEQAGDRAHLREPADVRRGEEPVPLAVERELRVHQRERTPDADDVDRALVEAHLHVAFDAPLARVDQRLHVAARGLVVEPLV